MSGNAAGVRISTAMHRINRRGFLRKENTGDAEVDQPLPIGDGQTNSQPTTVANMLELLDVPPRPHVLDVGSGSGWTTALLAYLVGPGGAVLGLERHPGLAEWGSANLAVHNMSWARIETAQPGELGRRGEGGGEGGNYDRILVSAAATSLPESLVMQLAPGGRMVIPVRMTMLLVERAPYLTEGPQGELTTVEDWGLQASELNDSTAGGQMCVTEHGAYAFVPLVP